MANGGTPMLGEPNRTMYIERLQNMHYQAICEVAKNHSDKLAIIFENDDTRTYEELITNAARIAYALLHEIELTPGDGVALWGWNSLAWCEVSLACSAAGLTCYLLNPEWTATEAAKVISKCDVQILFHDDHLLARANSIGAQVPMIRHLISLGTSGGQNLSDLMVGAPENAQDLLPPTSPDVGLPFFFTSGTTGSLSKAVVKTAAGRKDMQGASGSVLKALFNLDESSRFLVVTPGFHGNGNSGIFEPLRFGGSVVVQRRFSARRFWSLVDKWRPTFFFTLMPIVNILMSRSSSLERYNSLTHILALGIAPYVDAVEERLGVRVIDWYGSTEGGGSVYMPIDEPRKPGATGKKIPGTPMEIVREDLTPCEPNEVGQVAYPLEAIGFVGYLDEPEATKGAINGKYFMTGDLASIDEDGWFFFVDRIKDIVRRGGENISSVEVEAVLVHHPAIADIAIVPRPCEVLGERVTGFVILRNGEALPDEANLRQFAGSKLAHFKIPDLLIPVESFPRTQTGKVKKAVLKKQLKVEAHGESAHSLASS